MYPCPVELGEGHKTCPAQNGRTSEWSPISLCHRDLQCSNRGCSVRLVLELKTLGRGAADRHRQEQEWGH